MSSNNILNIRVRGSTVVWPEKCAACNTPVPKPQRGHICEYWEQEPDGSLGPLDALMPPFLSSSGKFGNWFTYPLCERCDNLVNQEDVKENVKLSGGLGIFAVLAFIQVVVQAIDRNFVASIVFGAITAALALLIYLIERRRLPKYKLWAQIGVQPNLEGGFVRCVGVKEGDLLLVEFQFQNADYAQEFRKANEHWVGDMSLPNEDKGHRN